MDKKPLSNQGHKGFRAHVLQGNFLGCIKGRESRRVALAGRYQRRNGGRDNKTSQPYELSSRKGHNILQFYWGNYFLGGTNITLTLLARSFNKNFLP